MTRDLSAKYLSVLLFNTPEYDQFPIPFINAINLFTPIFDNVAPHEFNQYVTKLVDGAGGRWNEKGALASMLLGSAIGSSSRSAVYCTFHDSIEDHDVIRSRYLSMHDCTTEEKLSAYLKALKPQKSILETYECYAYDDEGYPDVEKVLNELESKHVAQSQKVKVVSARMNELVDDKTILRMKFADTLHREFIPVEPSPCTFTYHVGEEIYLVDSVSLFLAAQLSNLDDYKCKPNATATKLLSGVYYNGFMVNELGYTEPILNGYTLRQYILEDHYLYNKKSLAELDATERQRRIEAYRTLY